jgi:alanine-glyoxylate transaminase/serine-glyoxylate transaminase/serine-pyruvate transaminase
MTQDVAAVRRAMDSVGHPALLVVDAIASLACIDLPMDAWGADCVIAASQKGLMLPPGLGFVAVGPKAAAVAAAGGSPRKYWDWGLRRERESYMWFYGTPPTQMIWGLRESLDMLFEEGLPAVFARHRRLADATRAAVERWCAAEALSFQTIPPAARSDTVTCIRMRDGLDPDGLRRFCRERLNVAFGAGLGPLEGKAFRIGHLGDLNEPMILGALATLETAMRHLKLPHGEGGLDAAVASLSRALTAE